MEIQKKTPLARLKNNDQVPRYLPEQYNLEEPSIYETV
jgi:hypothetical protein